MGPLPLWAPSLHGPLLLLCGHFTPRVFHYHIGPFHPRDALPGWGIRGGLWLLEARDAALKYQYCIVTSDVSVVLSCMMSRSALSQIVFSCELMMYYCIHILGIYKL